MSAQTDSRADSVDLQDRQPEAQSPPTLIAVDLTEEDDIEVPETQQSTDPAPSALRSTPETVVLAQPKKRKGPVGSGAGRKQRPKRNAARPVNYFDETPVVELETGSHSNLENPISVHNEILSLKRGAESTAIELGLLRESVKELRELNAVLRKRLDIAEEGNKRTEARLLRRMGDLDENLDKTQDDVIRMERQVLGTVTDRDDVITAFASMVNRYVLPSHSA